MKKNLFTLFALVLLIGMGSCSNDEEAIVQETPAMYSKTIAVYNDDKSASTEITITSDKQEILSEYLLSQDFILVKNVEAENANIENEDGVKSGEEVLNQKYISLSVDKEIPQGYALSVKEKTTNLKSYTISRNTYYLNFYNNTRYTLRYKFGTYSAWYGTYYIYSYRTVYHPQNGRYTYKRLYIY